MKKKKQSKQINRKSRQRKKIEARLFYLFIILTAAYYFLLSPKTIDMDYQYNLFVIIIPLIIGLIGISFYKIEYLKNEVFSIQINSVQDKVLFPILITFHLLIGIIISMATTGLITRVVFDLANYVYIQDKSIELVECPVTIFSKGGNSKYIRPDAIGINFMEKEIRLLGQLKEVNKQGLEHEYTTELQVKKGILNTYVVQDWLLTRK